MKYKEYFLAKNSLALKLFEEKEFKKLDKHLKELEEKNKRLSKESK